MRNSCATTKEKPLHVTTKIQCSQIKISFKKYTGYWPQISEVHIKGMISVSSDRTSSHTQKSAEFLNLGYLVFFT